MRAETRRMVVVMAGTLIVLALILSAVVALAATTTIEIKIEDTTSEGPEGSIHRVAGPVEVGEPGLECLVELVEIDNASPHAGTNAIVRSGASSMTFSDIEIPGAGVGGVGGFILDGPVEVFTQVGVDEVASIGYTVRITCPDVPATTTTTPDESPTTTTTVQQTTTSTAPPPSTSSTTEPPPEGGIDTGGGAMAIVNGQDSGILAWGGWVAIGFGLTLAAWAGVSKLVEIVRARR